MVPKVWGLGASNGPVPRHSPDHLPFADRKFAALYARQSQRAKFLIGCLVLFDHKLTRKIGPFDEKLALGADDFDLALRIREKGYRLRIACDVLIEHTVHANYDRSDPVVNEKLATSSWAPISTGNGRLTSTIRIGNGCLRSKAPVFPGEQAFI